MSASVLAQETLQRASSALKTGKVSTMPEIVQLVHTLSQKSLDISVQELADLVKKDTGVLAKTLMVANAFGYNPNGIRIETVTQAIQVIGFDRVRTLAMSLLLMEQTSRDRSAEEQREAAAHALCSGFIAQAVADEQAALPGEHAFVCAALRHFGRIVMTTFMTEEYRRARGLTQALPEDDAFREIFGLTPLELGHELLRAEQLPEEILSALRACDPASITAATATPEQRMLAIADFSTQLSELIFASGLDASTFNQRAAHLASRFSHLLPSVETHIPAFLTAVQIHFSRLKHGLGIRSLPLKCVERLKDRAAQRDPRDTRMTQTAPPFGPGKTPTPFTAQLTPPPFPTATPRFTAPPFQPVTPPPPPKPTLSSARLEAGLAHLIALASQAGTPADVIYRSVIDILAEAFGAPEVFLLLRPDNLSTLHITHGIGQNWRTFQSFATVTPGERTTFGLCLARRENLLIHDGQDAAIAPYVPGWMRDAPYLQAYVLLPIHSPDKPIGVVLAGWATKRRIVIAPEQVSLLRDLLAIVAKKHSPAPGPLESSTALRSA